MKKKYGNPLIFEWIFGWIFKKKNEEKQKRCWVKKGFIGTVAKFCVKWRACQLPVYFIDPDQAPKTFWAFPVFFLNFF